ncbi:MAG: hypothetical protein AO394_05425 [Candidatus Fermentibacter daniensis]|nr:MAG: hypothetical protein AO394_05425 [Candidatus Fermentibacter daniensis]
MARLLVSIVRPNAIPASPSTRLRIPKASGPAGPFCLADKKICDARRWKRIVAATVQTAKKPAVRYEP